MLPLVKPTKQVSLIIFVHLQKPELENFGFVTLPADCLGLRHAPEPDLRATLQRQ